MKIAVIPCGHTEWLDEARLLGLVELPLTLRGQQEAADWAAALRGEGLARILHSPDELATETAGIVARGLGIGMRAVEELHEVDVGLWAGLTEAELESRYATSYREFCEAPRNVHPPDGESLADAAGRLREGLNRIYRKAARGPVGVVLRPLALAISLALLEGRPLCELLESARENRGPRIVDMTGLLQEPEGQ